MKIGLYAGSFDPFQLGHLDIAIRAARLLDALYIGVGVNPEKHGGLFAPTDRVEMVRQTLNWHLQITPSDAQALDRIQVVQYNTLVNEAADHCGARVVDSLICSARTTASASVAREGCRRDRSRRRD